MPGIAPRLTSMASPERPKKLKSAQNATRANQSWLATQIAIAHRTIRISSSSSDARQPTFSVLASPEFVGRGVTFNMSVGGVDVERLSRAIGDVAEVTNHRTFVAFLDSAVQRRTFADRIEKVVQVVGFAALTLLFIDE